MEYPKSITISQLLQNLQEVYDQHGDITVYLSTATTGTELPLEQVTVGPLAEEPEPLIVRLQGPSSAGNDLDDW